MKYIEGIVISIVVIGVIALWVRGGKPKTLPAEPVAGSTVQTEQLATPPVPTQPKPLPAPHKKTTQNGMTIETTTQGSGDAITNGKTAVVDYVGSLIDGTVFDASKRHGNGGFSFQLGAGQVIKGWDQGVLGMKVGEVRVLTIPADLAYGAQGIPGVIPPNATLTFEVTLLAIK
jgi:FKBP-type peptidyl-prolyl cis-trans isomerase